MSYSSSLRPSSPRPQPSSCRLWIRSEIFDVGVFTYPTSSKLDYNNLSRFAGWVKSIERRREGVEKKKKGSVNMHGGMHEEDFSSSTTTFFPRITLTSWLKVACHKLDLTSLQARVYYDVFSVISDDHVQRGRMHESKHVQKEIKHVVDNTVHSESVHTLSFIVYLFLQQEGRILLKSRALMGDEFPRSLSRGITLSSSDCKALSLYLQFHLNVIIENIQDSDDCSEHSAENSTSPGNVGSLRGFHKSAYAEEGARLQFLRQHLLEFLLLIIDGPSVTCTSKSLAFPTGQRITAETLAILGFFIDGDADLDSNLVSFPVTVSSLSHLPVLVDLARQHDYFCNEMNSSQGHSSQGLGYLPSDDSFDLSAVHSWLLSGLGPCPFNQGNPRLRRSSSSSSNIGLPLTPRSGRSSPAIGGSASILLSKPLVLQRLAKKTILKFGSEIAQRHINILRCYDSFVYCLGPMKWVSVSDCRNCVIVLGAVERVVFLSNCRDVTVISTSRLLLVSQCNRVTLHVCVNLRPVLLENNHDIVFAPYHTYYASLEKDMQAAGVMPGLNQWDTPRVMVGNSKNLSPLVSSSSVSSPCWSLMPPEDLSTFSVPFSMQGITTKNPCSVPSIYEKSLAMRENAFSELRIRLKESNMSDITQLKFQTLVESRFQDWLVESGNVRQIHDLIALNNNISGSQRRQSPDLDMIV